MNERGVQDKLWPFLRAKGHEMICPNYTPLGWFECDMFSLTSAGYMVEHEIKLSRADFYADAKKYHSVWNGIRGEGRAYSKPTKHQDLALGSDKGPSRFWYVMPLNLVPEADVPEFSGILWLHPGKEYEAWDGSMRRNGSRLEVGRAAPALHRVKCQEKVMNHLGTIFYWRFWNGRQGYSDPGGGADWEI